MLRNFLLHLTLIMVMEFMYIRLTVYKLNWKGSLDE